MTNAGRIPRLLSLCVLWLLAAVSSAWAVDPSRPVSSYIHTRFTDQDGLPSTIVDQIAESGDGFLLLVAGGNLARFDGRHFYFFELAGVRAMALAEDGDLWVGTNERLEKIPAAALNRSGRVPTVSYRPDPGKNSIVTSLHLARNGVLWVGTSAGLYRFEHGAFSMAISETFIQRIEEASNGHLLVIASEGFVEWDGARAVPHPELAVQLGVKATDVFHVFEDSRGVTWFCTANGVARRIGGLIEKLAPWGPHGHGAYRAYEDPGGTVWFYGVEGLFRATAAGLELAVAGMTARSIYGDRDGSLWVGTNGDGLYRFKDRAVRMFTKADGLPNNTAMTVLATHDGAVWSGFNCGGIARFDGHGFRIYNEKNGLLNSCVFALAEDLNHDLWIGTFGGGAFRFHDGRFQQYSKPQGLVSDTVTSIVAAPDGAVWLCTPAGVSRVRERELRNYTVADGLSRGPCLLYEDRNRGLWVGTHDGVDRLSGNRFVNFSSLPRSLVYPLGEDRSGGLYFSVFPGGDIYRAESNRVIAITWTLHAPEMLVETDQGDLWLGGGNGILRVPRGALDHHHQPDDPLDFAAFGPADGLVTPQASKGRPDLALAPDGKLWIATTQGLALVDLPHLPRTDRKVPIYIQEVTVGRNQQPPGQELVLPPGTRHLELPFAAIELSSPEKIRLQYRLDSVDSEWLDAPSPPHAIYTNIPPGKHAFHIRACNRDGIWDRTGVVYYITQRPYFYETGWFRLATVMAGLLLLWGLYRLRLRQATARVTTRLEGRLAERSRIARELHDTLLQSFQGVVLLFQRAANLLPAGEAKQRLEGALDQAEQAIIEGRDAVHEMRSSEAASELSAAINVIAEELAAAQTGKESPTIHVRVEGTPRTLNTILYGEAYRIAVEALRNAFQHAQAHQIEAEIIYGERQLLLRVRDDGKGMDADILDHGSAGHFGLPGMRERAKLVGGSLEVRSKTGSGTEVDLAIPSSIAYVRSPATRRWFFGRFRRK